MFFDITQPKDFSSYILRRKDLLTLIKQQHPHVSDGLIMLIGGFEHDHSVFQQESSFYYFTGLHEPGVVLTIDWSGKTTLYIPNCTKRSQWVFSPHQLHANNAAQFGFDTITVLGEQCTGYQFYPFFAQKTYAALCTYIQQIVNQRGVLFTCAPTTEYGYIEQRLVLERLKIFIPSISNCIQDISSIIAHMRRKKDMREIEELYKAIEVTYLAHDAAAHAIADGMTEAEIQASLEYMMIASGTRPAFPSIVASGKNATILHYNINAGKLNSGDLVIVDIGAHYDHYCADITRTYPVSGTFTKEQRMLYNIVLETQEYIASIAQPGYWLSNKEHQDKSLQHCAQQFLAKKGYEKYFVHGIGHFLGLDVHDVGDTKLPLQEGDVITIEPGIYIPEKNIGIRIEDNYWIVKDGNVCLSEQLPKSADDIETWMTQELDVPEEGEEIDEMNADVELSCKDVDCDIEH